MRARCRVRDERAVVGGYPEKRRNRGSEGFTLTELLVAIALLGVVMAMVMVTVISFTQVSVNTSRSYTSQDHDQLVIDALGHYLPFVTNACSEAPFIELPQNGDPSISDPVEFFAQIGPNADSPPQVVAIWFEPLGVVGGEQEYSLEAEAAPIQESSAGACTEYPLWSNQNGQWGFALFDPQTFSFVSGSVDSKVVFDERDLVADPTSSTGSAFPPFEFCSAPVGQYAYGMQIDANMVANDSGLFSAINSIRVEISARIGKSPAATVVATFRSLNYRMYGPAQVPPAVTSGSPCNGDETIPQ